MTHLRPLVITALVAATGMTPLALAWGNDAGSEPSTPYDLPKFMWQKPNDRTQLVGGVMQDRIYFNVQENLLFFNAPNADLTLVGQGALNGRMGSAPVVLPTALLGYWRDCNNDGYIGDRVSGLRDYPARIATVDTRVCPPGTPYNPGTGMQPPLTWGQFGPMVHELLSIGPDFQQPGAKAGWSVNDTAARVWGDIGRPDVGAATTSSILPLPAGTLDSWNGHIRYVDDILGGRIEAEYAKLHEIAKDPDPNDPSDPVNYELPASIYDLPVLKDNRPRTPLYSVKQLYGQESKQSPEGRPAVRVWQCDTSDPEKDPTLSPRADAGVNTQDLSWSGGSVGDSVNNTVKGLIVNLPGGEKVRIGQGCDGNKGEAAVLNDGASLKQAQELQSPQEENARIKDRTDFYFTYTPPSMDATDQMTPSHASPGLFGSGVWNSGIALFHSGGIRGASTWTWYAKTDVAKHEATAVPGATFDPVQRRYLPPSFVYGQEACTSPQTGYNGWDCSAWPLASEAWHRAARDTTNGQDRWRIVLGETYQLRDTDCQDLSPIAPSTVTPLRRQVDDAYHRVVTTVLDPVPPGLDHVFTGHCP